MDGDMGRRMPALIAVFELAHRLLSFIASECRFAALAHSFVRKGPGIRIRLAPAVNQARTHLRHPIPNPMTRPPVAQPKFGRQFWKCRCRQARPKGSA
jgi:hypothetical protein